MVILFTGFGPFPGAPVNPTGRLALALARSPRLAAAGLRTAAHVFVTSYDAVDRELPALLERIKPDVLIMFGLATRSRHLRIESRARNRINRAHADASGQHPGRYLIDSAAGAAMPMRAPVVRLLRAARTTGVAASLSNDAGRYLCNYLCWRATAAAARTGGPKVAAFVHVPPLRASPRAGASRLTIGQLVRAGEAIARAAVVVARTAR